MAPVFIATWRVQRLRIERIWYYPATPKTTKLPPREAGGALLVPKSILI